MPLEICLVEDEPALLAVLGDALEESGHLVIRLADGAQARVALSTQRFDLLITDVRLPGVDGYSLAGQALAMPNPPDVVLMTAHGEIRRAVEMLKSGVRDYLVKPFDEEVLVTLAARLDTLRASHAPGSVVAASPVMGELLALARRAARSDVSVLITGETGSGKEVVARLMHGASPRAGGPFVAVNCAAIPAELLESELFGHTRGAFTGAGSHRDGWIRSADGGTLFLDEVGELSAGAQARMLRVLETHEVLPVGSDRTVAVDFRLISATHRDLRGGSERFRPDLLYRLASFELAVPPLRTRTADIPLLVERFLADLRARSTEVSCVVTQDALARLAAYDWPGNVRELRNAIEHAVVMAGAAPLQAAHLPPTVRGDHVLDDSPLDLREAIERLEAEQVRRALVVTEGRRGRAAELLGISRKHLWDLIRRHRIDA